MNKLFIKDFPTDKNYLRHYISISIKLNHSYFQIKEEVVSFGVDSNFFREVYWELLVEFEALFSDQLEEQFREYLEAFRPEKIPAITDELNNEFIENKLYEYIQSEKFKV